MKLPLISSRELCKFLEKEGFECIRQKGSYRFYRHLDGRTTVVPIHSSKDIKRGLLKGILDEVQIKYLFSSLGVLVSRLKNRHEHFHFDFRGYTALAGHLALNKYQISREEFFQKIK